MLCPYCNKEMTLGRIYSSYKTGHGWEAINQSQSPKYIYFKKPHKLMNSIGRFAEIKASVCPNCNKLIIDLNEEANEKRCIY